jgi:hypothetical protein
MRAQWRSGQEHAAPARGAYAHGRACSSEAGGTQAGQMPQARRRHAAERNGARSLRNMPAGVYSAPPARRVETRYRIAAVRTPARRGPRLLRRRAADAP